MRAVLFTALCVATPATADTFIARSTPQTVTVFSGGAQVTRVLSIDLPVGTHDVVLPDLPEFIPWIPPRITVANARLGLVTLRSETLPPFDPEEDEAVASARETVQDTQMALADHMDQEALLRLPADAASAELAFLTNLSTNEGLAMNAASLAELAATVAEKTRVARNEALNAEKSIRELAETREDLEEALEAAEDALAALLTADEDRMQAVVSISTDVATTAEITVTYFVEATWGPQYDVSLLQSEPAQVSIDRVALVRQTSGEDWTNVALVLSSQAIEDGIAPFKLRPQKRVIQDPAPLRPAAPNRLADPIIEAPVIVEEATQNAVANYSGHAISYAFPNPVTIANDVDYARIALDTLMFEARVYAQAVPLRDETAFLVAEFTNTSAEPFVETHENAHSVDGSFVGYGRVEEIPAGADGILTFGPIEDLRLTHTVIDQTDGDSGIINRSNTSDGRTDMTIENLGDRSWQVEVLDRVPFSEQEDLRITYSADPVPDAVNVDQLRGILRWDLELSPGAKETITINQSIRWPEDKVLR